MHFTMAKSAQDFFSNIIASEGSHGSKEKNKFIQFDVYYCCALIGMAAVQLDDDTSDLKAQLVDKYPKVYMESRAHIAGLLVATEAKRLGIDILGLHDFIKTRITNLPRFLDMSRPEMIKESEIFIQLIEIGYNLSMEHRFLAW